MSGEGPGEMAATTSAVNAQVDIKILIPSVKRRFGDAELIFQDDDASFYRAKRVQAFLKE